MGKTHRQSRSRVIDRTYCPVCYCHKPKHRDLCRSCEQEMEKMEQDDNYNGMEGGEVNGPQQHQSQTGQQNQG